MFAGGPVVGAAQRLAGEDVGVGFREFEADAVEFLVVGFVGAVHQGVAEGVEAAVAHVDFGFELFLDRLAEEEFGLFDGAVDEVLGDAVVAQVEEAVGEAGLVDLAGDLGGGRAVAGAGAGEVDDREHAGLAGVGAAGRDFDGAI